MKFPGAPYGLKMACGENPKRVYGGKGRAPSTRMGNVAGYRAAWIKAQKYRDDWAEYAAQASSAGEDGRSAPTATSSSRPWPACSRRHPGAEPLLPRRRDVRGATVSFSELGVTCHDDRADLDQLADAFHAGTAT